MCLRVDDTNFSNTDRVILRIHIRINKLLKQILEFGRTWFRLFFFLFPDDLQTED